MIVWGHNDDHWNLANIELDRLQIGSIRRADFLSAADPDQTWAKSGEEKLPQKDPNSQWENEPSPEWQAVISSGRRGEGKKQKKSRRISGFYLFRLQNQRFTSSNNHCLHRRDPAETGS